MTFAFEVRRAGFVVSTDEGIVAENAADAIQQAMKEVGGPAKQFTAVKLADIPALMAEAKRLCDGFASRDRAEGVA